MCDLDLDLCDLDRSEQRAVQPLAVRPSDPLLAAGDLKVHRHGHPQPLVLPPPPLSLSLSFTPPSQAASLSSIRLFHFSPFWHLLGSLCLFSSSPPPPLSPCSSIRRQHGSKQQQHANNATAAAAFPPPLPKPSLKRQRKQSRRTDDGKGHGPLSPPHPHPAQHVNTHTSPLVVAFGGSSLFAAAAEQRRQRQRQMAETPAHTLPFVHTRTQPFHHPPSKPPLLHRRCPCVVRIRFCVRQL